MSAAIQIKKVIVLGSAALKIGEAGEFDYSGSQAIKVLKAEKIESILINPNIATIQTSEELADKVYFLPVTPEFVEKVIERERPDGIFLSFGGQTALNCGLQLDKSGVLKKYNVKVLGTPVQTILETEDRALFVKKLDEIDVKTPRSQATTTVEESLQAAKNIGYPIMVRIAYALGGLGSGVCRSEAELKELASKALAHAPQILVEEYLQGWKEVEYEVVRDQFDNCVTVCNMENFDPLGIHTGESIVVAPSQTLTNHEYHKLREISIRTIRHLGIIGECNIQYALNPGSDDYRVIEVNARLSRSSALASKATGYPLAAIAAKLSLGYALPEIKNAVTQSTMACFEPALDYIVVKMPRWDLKKFRHVKHQIGTGMKSVGEVMAIGRSFAEAVQKVVRMLEIGMQGLSSAPHIESRDEIEAALQAPTDQRIFVIYDAFRHGLTVDRIHSLTHIDRWFLYCLQHIYQLEQRLLTAGSLNKAQPQLQEAKMLGFADNQLATLLNCQEHEVYDLRQKLNIHPCAKQIDTLGAEFPASTNYLYLTYHGHENDVEREAKQAVIILGSGAYRIGSSVEFDWCAVNTARSLKQLGYKTVMLNYNPETVSTDYDECDRLYFDNINIENIREIYQAENALGVVVSMGGQIPNNLALKLKQLGLNVLGTSTTSIDCAEDRKKFSHLLDTLEIAQPAWIQAASMHEMKNFAQTHKYPLLIRPSYVLSGAAMAVASNEDELNKFIEAATVVNRDHPVVVSKFIQDAKEIEIDAVAKNGEVIIYAISEHVENAGVHSGDATLVLPPQRTFLETIRQIKWITKSIAKALKIHGPFNIQFVAKDNEVYVIECNLRASRSFPFVSKVYRINFIDIATQIMLGVDVQRIDKSFMELDYVGIKAPQFSFTRLLGADPTVGVEMASTGEVGCLGDDFEEAFLKAMLSVGFKLPIKSALISSGPIESKAELLKSLRLWVDQGVKLYATKGTADFLEKSGVKATPVYWPLESQTPNAAELIRQRQVDLVINIPKNFQEVELTNDYMIRRAAVDYNIPLITNLQLARRFIESTAKKSLATLAIKHWDEYRHAFD